MNNLFLIYNEILNYIRGTVVIRKKRPKRKKRKNKNGRFRKFIIREKRGRPFMKLFTLCPIKNGFTPSYVSFSFNSLLDIVSSLSEVLIPIFKCKTYGEFRDKFKDKPKSNKTSESNAYQFYKLLFNISKYEHSSRHNVFEGANKLFHHFSTDGKTVSIYLGADIMNVKGFSKKKKKKTKEEKAQIKIEKKDVSQIDVSKYQTIIGIDPGIRNMYNGAVIKTTSKQTFV